MSWLKTDSGTLVNLDNCYRIDCEELERGTCWLTACMVDGTKIGLSVFEDKEKANLMMKYLENMLSVYDVFFPLSDVS